jgi:WD40 repeat protein
VLCDWQHGTTNTLCPRDPGRYACTDAAIAPGPTNLIAVSGDDGQSGGKVWLWHVKAGSDVPVQTNSVSFKSRVDSVRLTSDGAELFAVTADGLVYSCETTGLTPPRQTDLSNVQLVEVSPDRKYLLAVDRAVPTPSIEIWTASGSNRWTKCGEVFPPPAEVVNSARFDPSSRYILVACQDKQTYVYATGPTRNLVSTLRGHKRSVHSAEWSADGRYIVTASQDGTIRFWEAREGWFTNRASPMFPPKDDSITNDSYTVRCERETLRLETRSKRLWELQTSERSSPRTFVRGVQCQWPESCGGLQGPESSRVQPKRPILGTK